MDARLLTLALILCCLSGSGTFAVNVKNSSECLTHFRANPAAYNACRTNVCFLFISHRPYVKLDERMVLNNNQSVFRCKDRRKVFPDLGGVIFDVKDEVAPLKDSLCVYAGNGCSFDGMVAFISENASPIDGFQFGVTGVMFVLPHRILPTTEHSAPITDGNIVLLGRPGLPLRRPDPLMKILSPFEFHAWLSILGVALILLILWILLASLSKNSFRWRNIISTFAPSDPVKPPQVPGSVAESPSVSVEDMVLAHKLAFSSLKISVTIFLTVTVLFYEIAVVYYIYEGAHVGAVIDVQELARSELSNYITIRGGAEEYIFRQRVDPTGRYDNTTVPWNHCADLHDCFVNVLNKSHPAKLVVTYDFAVRYKLKKLGACRKLVVYKTKISLLPFNGVWYYNTNVRKPLRDDVDRAIVTLRQKGKMNEIITRVVDDSSECGKQSRQIPVSFLGPLLTCVLGPPILFFFGTATWLFCIRCRIRNLERDKGAVEDR